MGMGRGAKPPSYNVQTAVDADTGLILHHEVTDEATDNRMLHPMAEATRSLPNPTGRDHTGLTRWRDDAALAMHLRRLP